MRCGIIVFFCASWLFSTRAAADDSLSLEARETWSNVFGDKPVDLRFVVKSSSAFKGRAGWTFTANQRTIARGEVKLAIGAKQSANVDIHLPVPPIKNGAVFAAVLTVSVFANNGEKAETTLSKPIWIFPENPFHDRSAWLKQLKITLFDPEKQTSEVFRKMQVPCDEMQNMAAIEEVKEGVLIVGTGVSFKDYPELPEALVKAAARGVRVLCLAPAQGILVIPGADQPNLPPPSRVSWRRADLIAELDKRLDQQVWAGDRPVTTSSVALKAEEGKVVGEIVKGADGWAWLEARYPPKNGRLIVCGFGVIDSWDAGPTPRFLFVRILELLTGKSDHESSQEKETPK